MFKQNKTTKVECFRCKFEGDMTTTESKGGLYGDRQDRIHVYGACPSCGNTIISFFYTKKETT